MVSDPSYKSVDQGKSPGVKDFWGLEGSSRSDSLETFSSSFQTLVRQESVTRHRSTGRSGEVPGRYSGTPSEFAQTGRVIRPVPDGGTDDPGPRTPWLGDRARSWEERRRDTGNPSLTSPDPRLFRHTVDSDPRDLSDFLGEDPTVLDPFQSPSPAPVPTGRRWRVPDRPQSTVRV